MTVRHRVSQTGEVEEALPRSEAKYRAIFEKMQDIFFRTDRQGFIVEISPSVKRYGYAREELIGTPAARVYEDPEKRITLTQLLENGEVTDREVRLKARDGRVVDFSVSFHTMWDPDGAPAGTEGCLRDISDRRRVEEELQKHRDRLEELVGERTAELAQTNERLLREVEERRKAEEALRRSEEHFSKAFHASPLAIVMATVSEGRIVDVNEGFLQLMGYSREEVIERSTLELGMWVDSRDRERMVQEALKKGSVPNWELRMRTKSGETRVWLTAFVTIELDGVPCVLGMSRDVTERREAEEALRDSEERFRTLAASVPVGIFLTDAEGKIEYVNDCTLEITGLTALEETAGWRWGIDPHPDDREAVLAERTKAMAEGRVFLGDFRILTPQGVTRWVETRNSPLFDEKGEQIGRAGMVEDVTERRRAEEELQESVRLLGDTGEMAKVGGWELDLSTKEVSWTEEVSRIHGVEPGYRPKLEEALNFYAPESRPAVEAAVKKAAETGEPYDLESLFIPLGSKDRIWVRSLGKAVYSGGKVVRLAGTFQNIDKYKRADEALRESEKRFRQVLEVSSDLICRVDLATGASEYVSPAVLPLTGFTQEEFTALGIRGFRQRVHPDDWPRYMQRTDGFLSRGADVGAARRYEYRWQCKDGQYRWFSDSLALVRGEGGQPLALVVNARDTTERHQGEKALRESEERFRSLSAAAPIGIFLTDAQGNAIYANEHLQSLGGAPFGENTGHAWTKFIHADDRDAVLTEASRAAAEQREFSQEFRMLTSAAGERWVHATARAMLSPEGIVTGHVGTIEDITERKQAEERDRQLHAEHVRANELRRMVRILEQMAATLGHELRNPLGVISNSAYFLANQAGIDDPKVEKHAEIIGREVASAKRVIDDILEFAHVPEILPSPASLNAIVYQALARSQVPANIRVARTLAVDLPPLVCDEERLERGFLDVITNAVQAMPHGGRLSVKTRRSADSVAAVFADTGEGIAPQNLAKIFDPMFTTKLRGIGLGLTVVRRTVEQHGGRVEVRSVLGHGTTVTIMLPVGRAVLPLAQR